MIGTEKAEFLRILSGVAQVKGRDLNDDGVREYWESVRHLSLAQFTKGIREAARDSIFLPQPAEVISLAPPERPPWESQDLAACPTCRDKGWVLQARERGTYAVGCRDCARGSEFDRAGCSWTKRLESEGRLWHSGRD